MALSSAALEYIDDFFGYMDDSGIIPEEAKTILDTTLGLLTDSGGPTLTMSYNEEAGGYQLLYDGQVYTKSQRNELVAAIEDDPAYSGPIIYGSLSMTADGEQYGAAHLAEDLGTAAINLTCIWTPSTVKFPGANATVCIYESDGTTLPHITVEINPYNVVDLIAPYDDLIAAGYTASELATYKYLNYQIRRFGDGDVTFKCYLSTTPLGSGDYAEQFDALSLNQYNTSKISTTGKPQVTHAANSLSGGFALLQYDRGNAGEIDLSGSYLYGILFMNTSHAPLIYITNESKTTFRGETTSLCSITGTVVGVGGESETQLTAERMLSPMSSNEYPADTAMLAPVITPASGGSRSMRSKWLCMGKSDLYSSSSTVSAGFSTYYNDHGLCLGGGALT